MALLPAMGHGNFKPAMVKVGDVIQELLAYVDVNPYKLCPNFVGVSLVQRFGLKEVGRGKSLRIIQV
jgi:hypothetical protein